MSGDGASLLRRLDEALAPDGLMTRGAIEGEGGRTVVLVGHAGSSIWPHFEAWRSRTPEGGMPDPLDRWSRQMLETVAEAFGARAVFPSDRPYLPFQMWAMRADGLRPSPLGLLIHPDYGLWHAYRGALVFDQAFAIAPSGPKPHPCDTCKAKPCLSACPVDAFDGSDGARFDVAACRAHLASTAGNGCLTNGCAARHACPVGRAYAYEPDQQRFHMAAFATA